MVSMSTTVELQSKATSKGFGGLLKSAVGGEGLFASEFTASGGPGEVVLAPPTPGDIIEFNLAGQTLFAQSGAYLAGTNGLELGTKGSLKSMLSGEGIFLPDHFRYRDRLALVLRIRLRTNACPPAEAYTVDTGHMLAFEETMSYTVKKAAKGLFSTFASGEGLVARFEGSRDALHSVAESQRLCRTPLETAAKRQQVAGAVCACERRAAARCDGSPVDAEGVRQRT
jgi:uncharacterized protein (TIGR00266 family)